MELNSYKCRNCGNILVLDDGYKTWEEYRNSNPGAAPDMIGYCSDCKEWVPTVRGGDKQVVIANDLNQLRKALIDEKIREEKEKKRHRKMITALVIVLGLVAAAAAFFYFYLLPRQNYQSANALFEEGQYAEALDVYRDLKVNDSADRAILCEAFLLLQDNRLEEALSKVQSLEGEEDKLSGLVKEAITKKAASWEKNGIAPETLLSLLEKQDAFDQEHVLDKETLSLEAHTRLLSEVPMDQLSYDLDGDGTKDLIVLTGEREVEAYRMEGKENISLTVRKEDAAGLLSQFASQVEEADPHEALQRYLKSLEKKKDETVAGKAAMLYLEEARTLAEKNDAAAVDSIEQARALGLPLDQAIDVLHELAGRLEPGKARFELRLLEVRWQQEAGETAREVQAKQLLIRELSEAIDGREQYSVGPRDVLWLLDTAHREGIGITGWEPAYEEAALAIAGENGKVTGSLLLYPQAGSDPSGQDAAGRDGANYLEQRLLCVYEDGSLMLYGLEPDEGDAKEEGNGSGISYACFWEMDTGLTQPSMELAEKTILLLSKDKTQAAAYAATLPEDASVKLTALLTEEDLVRCRREKDQLLFGKSLEGSIERNTEYAYDLKTPEKAPQVSSIYFGGDDYSWPATPEETIQRYFEAYGYQIEEEKELLTASGSIVALGYSGYDFGTMEEFELPKAPFTVSSEVFDQGKEASLLEVSWKDKKGEEHIYAAALREDDHWKAAGFSKEFAPGMGEREQQFEAGLLALNRKQTGRLEDKNDRDVYRMLLPRAAKTEFRWKAGDKTGTSAAFRVQIFNSLDLVHTVASYDLVLSEKTQISPSLFLQAGIYYVQVEPQRFSDTDYQLTMKAEYEDHMETEENNTSDLATAMQVNEAYTGSLYKREDVDWYQVTLEKAGAMNVLLQSQAESGRQVRYQFSIYTQDGTVLTSGSLAGDETKAESGRIYLNAGVYLISIEKGNKWSSADYQVTAQVTAAEELEGGIELEVNDTKDLAGTLPANRKMTGTFGKSGDVDYYRVQLEHDCIFQPKLKFTPLETTSRTYTITLEKGSAALASWKIGGKESEKILSPVLLEAGEYYLKIENPNFVRQDYILSFACEEVEKAEMEPNDTLAQALKPGSGETVTGFLSSAEDVDLYQLVFDGETVCKITFLIDPGNDTSSAFRISIQQNGKTLWKSAIPAAQAESVFDMQFPAGEYYLKIESVNYLSTYYRLKWDKVR